MLLEDYVHLEEIQSLLISNKENRFLPPKPEKMQSATTSLAPAPAEICEHQKQFSVLEDEALIINE